MWVLVHVWLFVTLRTNLVLPGSSVHGILQARILEWVAIFSSRRSSWPRDRTRVSCIAGGLFTHWTTWEAPKGPHQKPCIRASGLSLQVEQQQGWIERETGTVPDNTWCHNSFHFSKCQGFHPCASQVLGCHFSSNIWVIATRGKPFSANESSCSQKYAWCAE